MPDSGNNNPERQPINIVVPPDFIFKYRKPSRVEPSREVINNNATFDFVGVKYPAIYHESDEFFKKTGMEREWFKYPVAFQTTPDGQVGIVVAKNQPELTKEEERMGGQLACFQYVPYPYKGHPFPQAIYAVNVAKRNTRELLEFYTQKDMRVLFLVFSLFPKKKKIRIGEHFLKSYVSICRKSMETFIVKEEFMNKYGKEINRFVANALIKWGVNDEIARDFSECFASQIDWDNAYWMRIGDAMVHTSKEEMLSNPRKEFLKIGNILAERQIIATGEGERLKKVMRLASYLLLVPRYKKIFKECIELSAFDNFQFDDADNYHCLVYVDYNYLGKTAEERIAMYKKYHEEHPPEPKRIVIAL